MDDLVNEANEIQRRLRDSIQKEDSNLKGFTRLMLEGKVKQAIKLIDQSSGIVGVHEATDAVLMELERKHPVGQPKTSADEELAQGNIEEVIFQQISSESIIKVAQSISGSGGPTKIASETWKRILCSKAFGDAPSQVAEEVARLARRLAVTKIDFGYIDVLLNCRLVPLKKEDNGIRPIGVGEILRRIIGKSVTQTLSEDIQTAAGSIQTCTGLSSGIDASIHAMRKVYEQDWCEAVLLVDAENAFNQINRKEALHNIKKICPPFFQYVENTYQSATNLYLNNGSYIQSQEGVTQGDNAAMAIYGLAVTPLIKELSNLCTPEELDQTWYADDSSSGGRLQRLKEWWLMLKEKGAPYGYIPKPSKTHLLVKNEEHLQLATELFQEEGETISLDGKRHIGAALGTDAFKKEYVSEKVQQWCNDVEQLAMFANDEPQASFSAFSMGVSKRCLFIQRTVEDTASVFEPLEHVIGQKFIPAIVGRQVSDIERKLYLSHFVTAA